ncbi:hypothetical protein, partial [Aquitalea magnusonii]|uniref:hypothetical protein n=1 Tax=Aquitalea magnusonii TaxID=332411 RepID=UPI00195F04BE
PNKVKPAMAAHGDHALNSVKSGSVAKLAARLVDTVKQLLLDHNDSPNKVKPAMAAHGDHALNSVKSGSVAKLAARLVD